MKYKNIVLMVLSLFLLTNCVEYEDDKICKDHTYLSFDQLKNKLKIEIPREIKKAGKIYLYKNLILVSDAQEGIHIIDNSDTKNPKNLHFITILGNVDMAVRDGYLYADSYQDLVVLDIRNENNITEVARTKNIFPKNTYFDENDLSYRCNFDFSNGFILGGK